MNVLLLDKNIYYCKTLINAMSALNKEIKIAYVANSIEELTHFYDVDVILADSDFIESGIENMFYNCQCIYLSHTPDNQTTFSKENVDLIIRHIEIKSHNLSEEYIEKMLYSELILLGYPPLALGSKCMLEALKLIYNSDKTLSEIKLVKDIYPKVAEKLGISPTVVKGNMHYATRKMLNKFNKEYLMHYYCLDRKSQRKISITSDY